MLRVALCLVFACLWSMWVVEVIMAVGLAWYPFDDFVTRVRVEDTRHGAATYLIDQTHIQRMLGLCGSPGLAGSQTSVSLSHPSLNPWKTTSA